MSSACGLAALAVFVAAVALELLPAVGTGGLVAAIGGVKLAAVAWALVSRGFDPARFRAPAASIV